MPKIDLKPRKAPRQQRSQEMLDLILQAATRVLRRESLAGFNTNRVAEVAGISVGSLYQYFPNKAALVTALIARAHAKLADALQALVDLPQPGSLRETLQAVAALAVEQQYGDPVLAAALDHEEQRLPIQPLLRQFDERLHACTSTLLLRHRAELSHALPASAARDCLVITQALVEADAHRSNKPPPDLEQRIVRALLGYLTL